MNPDARPSSASHAGVSEADPLILTLRLDEEASRFFDEARRRYFPSRRNVLRAHVTMFHALPGGLDAFVRAQIAEETEALSPFATEVSGLRSLGRGVAYALASEELSGLRGRLARRFAAFLTTQDAQGYRPHVTVQNKVSPDEARALLRSLEADFEPWEAQALGLDLFAYRGGPWESLGFFPFAA